MTNSSPRGILEGEFYLIHHILMKISTKTKILSLSALTLSLSSLALANDSIRETIIKPDLSHTVQSIEKIIFSSQGIQGDTSAIPLTNQQGVIHLEGKFSATSTEEAKTNSNNWENSLLIWGKENKNSGKDSTIIVGRENIIDGEKSILLGGKENKGKWVLSTIIWGKNNEITKNSNLNTIIWGDGTTLSAQKNISLGANDSAVNGSHNTIAGSKIHIANANVKKTFVWSDNKNREANPRSKTLIPQTSNTLYLRSENGVMINTATPSATLSVGQMVQLGDEAGNCSPDKIGTLIFRNGCFYACSDGQSWDNLAGTAECGGSGIKTITFDIPTPADLSKRVELGQKAAPQGPKTP